MKQIKKVASLVLVFFMLISLSPPSFAAEFLNISEAEGIAPGNSPMPEVSQPFYDTAFGTKLVRISDSTELAIGSTAGKAHVNYSYWPALNCDSTKVLVGATLAGHMGIYNFDAATMTASYAGPLYNYTQGYVFNEAIRASSAYWSSAEPEILYGVKQYNPSAQLVRFNVETKESVVIKNFAESGDLPAGYAEQLSKANNNDRYFAFHFMPDPSGNNSDLQDDKWAVRKAVVYDSELDRTYTWDIEEMGYDCSRGNWRLDEVRLDKEGQYLLIYLYNDKTGATPIVIWEFAEEAPEEATLVNDGPVERGGQHYDMGSGIEVQADRFAAGPFHFIKRDLSNPKAFVPLTSHDITSYQNISHISLLGPDDTWALVSTYTSYENSNPDYSVPFTNEMFLLKTDGSGDVIRLAQTHGTTPGYEYCPMASISPDGRFFAFNSNWAYGTGGNGSLEVYIGKMPEGIWLNYLDNLDEIFQSAYDSNLITSEALLKNLLKRLEKMQDAKDVKKLKIDIRNLIQYITHRSGIDKEFAAEVAEALTNYTNIHLN